MGSPCPFGLGIHGGIAVSSQPPICPWGPQSLCLPTNSSRLLLSGLLVTEANYLCSPLLSLPVLTSS